MSSFVYEIRCPGNETPSVGTITVDPGGPDEWEYQTWECTYGGSPQWGRYYPISAAPEDRLFFDCDGTVALQAANPNRGACSGLWINTVIAPEETVLSGIPVLSTADAASLITAILGLWALAYGIRQVVNVVRNSR